MSHSRVPLKNPWLAMLLAFLIPGLGHLYQGRRFKAAIYFLCIVPTFLYGMHLGDWRVTYWLRDPTNVLNPYYAQFWVGLPALPSLIQSRRFQSADNPPNPPLEAAVACDFQGTLRGYHDSNGVLRDGKIDGQITLEPVDRAIGRVKGNFNGTLTTDNGTEPIEFSIGGVPTLDTRIGAEPRRQILCDVVSGNAADEGRSLGKVTGSIPRTFWNWFQVPPTEFQVQDLNRELGKMLELAQIFTMIAGLLNILAIWDALEGPAYGYGELHSSRDDANPPDKKSAGLPPSGTPDGRAMGKPQPVTARSGMG